MKITKPTKDGILNTWLVDIDGFLNLYDDENNLKINKRTITVRFTSDLGKETLSFSDENKGIQYVVNFKKVQELIEIARANNKVGKS